MLEHSLKEQEELFKKTKHKESTSDISNSDSKVNGFLRSVLEQIANTDVKEPELMTMITDALSRTQPFPKNSVDKSIDHRQEDGKESLFKAEDVNELFKKIEHTVALLENTINEKADEWTDKFGNDNSEMNKMSQTFDHLPTSLQEKIKTIANSKLTYWKHKRSLEMFKNLVEIFFKNKGANQKSDDIILVESVQKEDSSRVHSEPNDEL